MRGFSVGATAPAMADIAALRSAAGRAATSISGGTGRPYGEIIEAAVRAAGARPRAGPASCRPRYRKRGALDDVLSRLTRWPASAAAHRRRRSHHARTVRQRARLIESGLLQRHGIAEIGVAGYPEGHPRISDDVLDRALAAKIEAAEQTGLDVSIVTQLGFDADAVLGWVTAAARSRHRAPGPHRHGRSGGSHVAHSPCAPLRRPRHGAVADAPCRIDQASARRRHARTGIRPLAEAATEGALGRVAAHFFAARRGRNRALGSAAASGRVVPKRAAGSGSKRRRSIEARALASAAPALACLAMPLALCNDRARDNVANNNNGRHDRNSHLSGGSRPCS